MLFSHFTYVDDLLNYFYSITLHYLMMMMMMKRRLAMFAGENVVGEFGKRMAKCFPINTFQILEF